MNKKWNNESLSSWWNTYLKFLNQDKKSQIDSLVID